MHSSMWWVSGFFVITEGRFESKRARAGADMSEAEKCWAFFANNNYIPWMMCPNWSLPDQKHLSNSHLPGVYLHLVLCVCETATAGVQMECRIKMLLFQSVFSQMLLYGSKKTNRNQDNQNFFVLSIPLGRVFFPSSFNGLHNTHPLIHRVKP